VEQVGLERLAGAVSLEETVGEVKKYMLNLVAFTPHKNTDV
jgi:hypothetical protein